MSMNIEALLNIVASDRAGRLVPTLGCAAWWESALSILVRSEEIAIVTGFMVPSASAPETDGPSGAAVLGRCLQECGKDVMIFTDPYCLEVVERCSVAINGPNVLSVETGQDIIEAGPDLLIFVERLGRTSNLRYCNMRCKDISGFTYPLDDGALLAAEKGIKVVAIGDGGNEVGMGNIAKEIGEIVPDFRDCICSIGCDVLLPSDVSNWGAYALAAMLSCYYGKWCGHFPDDEANMLDAVIDAGAVDGVTTEKHLSVDGFGLNIQNQVVQGIYGWYTETCSKDY